MTRLAIQQSTRFRCIKPEYKHILGAIAFDSKDTCPPLASADAMVHTLYQSKVDPGGWQKAKARSPVYIPTAAGLSTISRSRIQLYTANRNNLADLRKVLDGGTLVGRIVPDD